MSPNKMFTLKMIRVLNMGHGGNIYGFGTILSEAGKSGVEGGFNYVKSAGRGTNDNQLRFISVEPAAKRK